MSTHALIYTRISEDREGAGLGVARQAADCHDLAERLGWTVVGAYSDNDMSAYSGKPRPGYRDLLAALERGEATGVLVWHTDRLHRSPVELEAYVEVCERLGVVTQTVKAGELDLSSPSGRLVARQLGAVARYEIEHMIERQQAARIEAVKAGKWTGGRRPYGYEPDGVTVRQDEADVVLRATEQVVAGRALRTIAAELNLAGTPTSTGGRWSATELRRCLLRCRNVGLVQYRGEAAGRAVWPAIVPEDLWRAARAILTDPRRRSNVGAPRRYLGSGLYLCGVCADGTTLHSSTANGRRAYTCPNSKHVSRAGDDLDAYVEALVVERLTRPDAAEALVPPTPDVSGLHVEAEGLRARLDELARLFADGAVDAGQLTEASQRLRSNLSDVEGRIAAAAAGSALGPFVGRPAGEVWAELDVDQRRAVVGLLMTVVVHPAPKGRPAGWKPGESYFDPASVEIVWKGAQ